MKDLYSSDLDYIFSESQDTFDIYSDDIDIYLSADSYFNNRIDYDLIYDILQTYEVSLEAFLDALRYRKPAYKGEYEDLLNDSSIEARNRLIEIFHPVAIKFALQLNKNYKLDLDELISITNLGLIEYSEKCLKYHFIDSR